MHLFSKEIARRPSLEVATLLVNGLVPCLSCHFESQTEIFKATNSEDRLADQLATHVFFYLLK